MSPKMGQKLTDNPKDKRIEIRMDKETVRKMDCLASEQNSDRSKVIRQGICGIYDELVQIKERRDKMTIGDRGESIEEKRKRHIKESKSQIDGWKSELQYAIDHEDIKCEKYCHFMIEMWENTLEKLNSYEIF